MDNEKITIFKNPNSDTRTAPLNVSYETFQKANNDHINDVFKCMSFFSKMLYCRGVNHDYTKRAYSQEYYNDFLDTMNNGSDFTKGKWFQNHISKERHHLLYRCPEDVNLIDIIEMICDSICAGLARSGDIRDLEFNNDILNKAVENTVKLLRDQIILLPTEDNYSSEELLATKIICDCNHYIDLDNKHTYYQTDTFVICPVCGKVYLYRNL